MKFRKIDKEAVRTNPNIVKIKEANEKKNEDKNEVNIKDRYFELYYVDLD